MNTETYHVPVLLSESVDGLNIQPAGLYVDVTMGGAGHSRAILGRLGSEGRLFGFDQDADAVQNAPHDGRFTFVRSNFRFLRNWLRYYGVDQVDGVLADLGVSSHHFDEAGRGFSLRADGPLDMRMNRQARLTAADVVNGYEADDLARIFGVYGEMRNARALAAAIVRHRSVIGSVGTTMQLQQVLQPLLHPAREKKEMAKVFQALRIEVNGEMQALADMLTAAVQMLKPGGRLVVLSYHSLEDRMVKNYMRSGNQQGQVEMDFYGNVMSSMRLLKGYAQEASPEEQERNPRSRSARLRVGEKTA